MSNEYDDTVKYLSDNALSGYVYLLLKFYLFF
jgi:hypothetical protein